MGNTYKLNIACEIFFLYRNMNFLKVKSAIKAVNCHLGNIRLLLREKVYLKKVLINIFITEFEYIAFVYPCPFTLKCL